MLLKWHPGDPIPVVAPPVDEDVEALPGAVGH
jgi:hypothetical protein